MTGTLGLIAVWALASAVGFALHPGGVSVRLAVQACIYLALAIGIARQPALGPLLAELPRRGRFAIFAFLVVLVTFQLAERPAESFPFATWKMYTENTVDDPTYYEFSGFTHAGREIELNFAREFVGFGRKIHAGLRAIADAMDAEADAVARSALAARYDATLIALAGNYNRLHPERPVVRVRVWRRTIPSSPFRGLATITRALTREIDVE